MDGRPRPPRLRGKAACSLAREIEAASRVCGTVGGVGSGGAKPMSWRTVAQMMSSNACKVLSQAGVGASETRARRWAEPRHSPGGYGGLSGGPPRPLTLQGSLWTQRATGAATPRRYSGVPKGHPKSRLEGALMRLQQALRERPTVLRCLGWSVPPAYSPPVGALALSSSPSLLSSLPLELLLRASGGDHLLEDGRESSARGLEYATSF